jgi:hypothetical protein
MTITTVEKPVRPPRRWLRRLLLLLFIGIPALYGLFVLSFFLLTETYFAPAPWIGTHVAPDYNEEGFDQIQIGDSKERVLELIGEPLRRAGCDIPECASQTWVYSEDLTCCLDFAWLYRDVSFDAEDQVIGVSREIFYD